MPVDVVKTRIMNAKKGEFPVSNVTSTKTILCVYTVHVNINQLSLQSVRHCVLDIFKTSGIIGFFKVDFLLDMIAKCSF